MTRTILLLFAIGILVVSGCGESPPQIIPVSGVVTINDKPLPNAEVRFIPMQDGLDGNYVATGITDKSGAFTLKFPGKVESGCCAGECKVVIGEGPIPDEARGETEAAFRAATQHRKSQVNRPIPKQFERIGTTTLSYTIDDANKHFEIKLKR